MNLLTNEVRMQQERSQSLLRYKCTREPCQYEAVAKCLNCDSMLCLYHIGQSENNFYFYCSTYCKTKLQNPQSWRDILWTALVYFSVSMTLISFVRVTFKLD
jgi:hypothetical protein